MMQVLESVVGSVIQVIERYVYEKSYRYRHPVTAVHMVTWIG